MRGYARRREPCVVHGGGWGRGEGRRRRRRRRSARVAAHLIREKDAREAREKTRAAAPLRARLGAI
jgi:hypothetical protein